MLALKEPVTQKKINQAKSDIEKMGGKILYEITLGMHGFAVAIPSNTVIAMDQKDYVEFMEQDHTVHAFQD
ncbi:uncharacterized protein B0P05DRAFT_524523 [Gilbertella persicaria]|uniref:uncharacterized protein n=1 Tax=Gilbertella persicaria TaxID=101096 RepID=UPI002220C82D|nr:uncharacterized protein B0P05DRAFT_524523 [Gilbertella persicaria]KAI8095057.1 hypothetical protein B0P05DRAFT_524523 [Gilbertella persicaria]